jgi:hypothetical protein
VSDQTTDTTHKNPEHTYINFLMPLTPSVEKIVNLLHGFEQVYKPRYLNVLVSVDHNGMAAHLTRSDCEGL